MAGKSILFTFLSCADVNDIWEAIAMPRDPWSASDGARVNAAATLAAQFAQICELLPKHPEIGIHRDDLNPGVCSVAIESCTMYYRTRGECVEVLRVLRGNAHNPRPSGR